MKLISDPRVQEVFHEYPKEARKELENLRNLIIEVAEEIPGLTRLEETLRWGEPSYITKNGSTLRMDWKEKSPSHFSLFFKCTSSLVPTFRQIYPEEFHYEGNREIRFEIGNTIPSEPIKECIRMTLNYHRLKKLPLLGHLEKSKL